MDRANTTSHLYSLGGNSAFEGMVRTVFSDCDGYKMSASNQEQKRCHDAKSK